MIIYNVTIKIDLSVHDSWLKWMKDEHIPRMIETGCFRDSKIYRVIEDHSTDGITYEIQYFARRLTDYYDYKEHHSARMQKEGLLLFSGKFSAFRTLQKEISADPKAVPAEFSDLPKESPSGFLTL